MDNKEYERKVEHIYHMNCLIRSLNDEDAIMPWLMGGVPDGTYTLDEIRDCYDNDEFFEEDYEDMVRLFVRILKGQTKNDETKGLFY